MKYEPAFPTEQAWSNNQGSSILGGLTKREWFAGMSLMGLRASGSCEASTVVGLAAYCDADAMIEAGKPNAG